MKLTKELKLEIISKNVKGITKNRLAKEYGVSRTTILRLFRSYREHGLKAVEKKVNSNKYSADFKLDIVKRVSNGESKSSIETKTGINCGLIYAWCKKYETLGYNGLKSDLRGRKMSKPKVIIKKTKISDNEELEYLRERNQDLEMEIDLLKKLDALVQQRKQQQDKK